MASALDQSLFLYLNADRNWPGLDKFMAVFSSLDFWFPVMVLVALIVVWKGGFYRSWGKNDPPPEQSDAAAVKAVTATYQGGLANLKKLAEQ